MPRPRNRVARMRRPSFAAAGLQTDFTFTATVAPLVVACRQVPHALRYLPADKAVTVSEVAQARRRMPSYRLLMATPCAKCKGTGAVRCGTCAGAGYVQANVDLPGVL